MAADLSSTFVYKIMTTPPPENMPENIPLSGLDLQDGFVHLSTLRQVPNTCDLFFSDASELWFLKFDLVKFADPIKWEGGFPHLYGNLESQAVVWSRRLYKSPNETWSQVINGSDRLQD